MRRIGRPNRADVDETAHRPGGFGGGDYVGRALPVDGVKLAASAANHRHQVNHLGDVAARLGEGVGV